ncbi:hypothetical protein Cob_v004869 [Colletotrichum orbiculare MAFF 240422]|uniref:Uncharacterized protein n=1 Tax=Colletotrichum orbiculare (strain 104-T / ATCC 96160 / CBS 514.97 / LARS 414 / MAFF 240422) TaxID=1213857 RepID=A0A484FVU1_COLOR|nr:hypothetical protein Cob_v004869 [Colletotrichum orbiculare MAFF 240422]
MRQTFLSRLFLSESSQGIAANRNPRNIKPYVPDPVHQPSLSARLAQSVERETLNLKVVGSTPTSGSIPVSD